MKRILVAGIGNIFFGDDAFGVEVVRQLHARPSPAGVELRDIGIRAIDLAFALQDPWDLVILVDATRRGHAPGSVCVLDLNDVALPCPAIPVDGHGLQLEAVLAAARSRQARIGSLRLVGCEPERLTSDDSQPILGLSPTVAAAVPRAAALVHRLIAEAYEERREPATVEEHPDA